MLPYHVHEGSLDLLIPRVYVNGSSMGAIDILHSYSLAQKNPVLC